jgi:hypothetical protein
MNTEHVTIARLIRRMRGGSQAQLVEGSDGHLYVATFLGNPQGHRTSSTSGSHFKFLRSSASPLRQFASWNFLGPFRVTKIFTLCSAVAVL